MDKKLTQRQIIFCNEFIKSGLAGKSAIVAGCPPGGGAAVQGNRWLNNPLVQEKINELRALRETREISAEVKLDINADYLRAGFQEIAERCMEKAPVMKFNAKTKEMEQVKDHLGRDVWQFDSNGANKALELLGKHIGFFETDNNQKRAAIQINYLD